MGNLVIAIIGIVFSIALLAAGISYIKPTAYIAHNQADINTSQVEALVGDYNNLAIALGHRPTAADYLAVYPTRSPNSVYSYSGGLSSVSALGVGTWNFMTCGTGGAQDCFCLTVPAGNVNNRDIVYKAAQISALHEMNSSSQSRVEISSRQCADTNANTSYTDPNQWATATPSGAFYLTVRMNAPKGNAATGLTYAASVSYFGCSNTCGAGYKQPDLSTFTCTDSNNTPAPGKCPTPGAQSCYDTSGCVAGGQYTYNPIGVTYASCTPACSANSTQSLNAGWQCQRQPDLIIVAQSYCNPAPSQSQTCADYSLCNYSAVPTYGACTSACGLSSQPVTSWYCLRSDGTQFTSASNTCQSHNVAAPGPKTCSDYSACQASYSITRNDQCSVSCGAGTNQLQNFVCTKTTQTGPSSSTTSSTTLQPGSSCGGVTPPTTGSACNNGACASCGTTPGTCGTGTVQSYNAGAGTWNCGTSYSGSVSCSAPPVNGSCATTANTCNAGTAQNYNATSGTWQCAGQYGGSTAACTSTSYSVGTTTLACAPACGTSSQEVDYRCVETNTQTGVVTYPSPSVCQNHGVTVPSQSTHQSCTDYSACQPACGSTLDTCAVGTVGNVFFAFSWTCTANSSTKLCFAFLPPVDGSCGPSTYSPLMPYPCNTGTAINQSDNGTNRSWNCAGTNGGATSTQCTGVDPVYGVCGTAKFGCTIGTAITKQDYPQFSSWTCDNNGYYSPICYGPGSGSAINGACGSAKNSCTTGTLSGPQADNGTTSTWYCNGSNGGSNSGQCSASNVQYCTPQCGVATFGGSGGCTAYCGSGSTGGTNGNGVGCSYQNGVMTWSCSCQSSDGSTTSTNCTSAGGGAGGH